MKGVRCIPRSTLAQLSSIASAQLGLYDASVEELIGRNRNSILQSIRRAVWYKLWHLGWNFSEIARAFRRDHSTIIEAVRGHKGHTKSKYVLER